MMEQLNKQIARIDKQLERLADQADIDCPRADAEGDAAIAPTLERELRVLRHAMRSSPRSAARGKRIGDCGATMSHAQPPGADGCAGTPASTRASVLASDARDASMGAVASGDTVASRSGVERSIGSPPSMKTGALSSINVSDQAGKCALSVRVLSNCVRSVEFTMRVWGSALI